MAEPVRVMLERGKKKRVVACAFDWPGWDRSATLRGDAVEVLESYRRRYAEVAELAGYGADFAALGPLEVVEEVEGIGMTDYYGVSGRPAAAERQPMTQADVDRKVALLEAAWATFDRTAFAEAIREHHEQGATARSWELQFLIRRCAWHMLDHAWELEDRDQNAD